MMNKYFANCTTLEELKAEYKRLALMHHPDRGGDGEVMKEINAEYDRVFPKLKNVHKTKEGKRYEKENNETAGFFKSLIDELLKMEGVHIEIIGCFVWVSGDTKPHKEQLKKLGFKWHSKKICWYLAPIEYQKKSKKQYSMDEVRQMFGVQYSADVEEKSKKLTA